MSLRKESLHADIAQGFFTQESQQRRMGDDKEQTLPKNMTWWWSDSSPAGFPLTTPNFQNLYWST